MTYTVSWNDIRGVLELQDSLEHAVREEIRVRAELREKALRDAVVSELRRLGYTVIPPEGQP